jgi:hypothetical protein
MTVAEPATTAVAIPNACNAKNGEIFSSSGTAAAGKCDDFVLGPTEVTLDAAWDDGFAVTGLGAMEGRERPRFERNWKG